MSDEIQFLVISASRVLSQFRRGNNPTFDELDRLENSLEPFVAMKQCGHVLIEDCECEQAGGMRS